jgi:hypothetical protein
MEVILGLPLGPDEFLGLLTGSPAHADAGPRPRPGGGSVELIYEIDSSGGARHAQVKIVDPAGGVSLYEVEYLDPAAGPWGLQAREIHLRHGGRGLTLRLKDASRERPPAEAFQVRVPARFEEVPLHQVPNMGGLLFDDEAAP